MVATRQPRTSRWLGLVAAACLGACAREPAPVITGADGSQMIHIPAGEFLMGGREEEFADRPELAHFINYEAERPVHAVVMQGFYFDKHEVTQAQYGRFVQALAADPDRRMEHPDQPAGLGHEQQRLGPELLGDLQPAVGLNWFDAYAYCQWAGKRLPTEAEWEYAARGGNAAYRTYPWGDAAPDADGKWRANFWPAAGRGQDGFFSTAPVGSFPEGLSPFGIADMAGNAEEWVHDWLDLRYYRTAAGRDNPTGPVEGTVKVIKGGSQVSNQLHIRIATRLFGDPSVKSPNLGIRCACDP